MKKKKRLNRRAITSLTLLLTTIMMPVSAWISHAMHGTEAGHTWLHLHGLLGILFVIAGVFHIVYNWRILMNYLGLSNSKK